MLEASAPLGGSGWLTLLVSRFSEELLLAALVSGGGGLLIVALSVPDWPVADAPVPVVSVVVVSVAPMLWHFLCSGAGAPRVDRE